MTNPGLSYRQPELRWMAIAGVAALCLHGLCWLGAIMLNGHSGAFAEVQRQVMLALFWMIGTLIIWKIAPSPSRLHAVMTVLACALFVCGIGSVFAIANLVFIQHYNLNSVMKTLGLASLLLLLMQLCLAVPSAILLQAIAMKRNSAAG
ncbi:hypothetical protein [Asticcacaulis taihuensis]|uniref:hypothetical protein n=1 Tax=Asticcacaulis taihuensis TaxID=260084 RepID=UPI0026E93C5C|nr:hypothetical protein [Asticcacaulis taihuensis]